MRPPLTLTTLAAALALTGCATDIPTPTTTPTPPFSMADVATQAPTLGAAKDATFLILLDKAGIPHPNDREAITGARIVCATLAVDTGTRGEIVFLFEEEGGLPFINAAADTYCPELTPSSAAPSGPAFTISEGTHVVGTDIEAGTYKTTGPVGSSSCYWARLKDTAGDGDSIITNNLTDGPATVTIKSSDAAFETSRCALWTKVS